MHNMEEPNEVQHGKDKSLREKNSRRRFKTPSQLQALEDFYNEHKYPTESMKSELDDVNASGCKLTWQNNRAFPDQIWAKLHRILCNESFADNFNFSAEFLPCYLSDHSPMLVSILFDDVNLPRPFKFVNGWVLDPAFESIVSSNWKTDVTGSKIYILSQKLRRLKVDLKQLHKKNYTGIGEKVNRLRKILSAVQKLQESNPDDVVWLAVVKLCKEAYIQLRRVELDTIYQRAKAEHILKNDENIQYFYARVNERRKRNGICNVIDIEGKRRVGTLDVGQAFVEYYIRLLGTEVDIDTSNLAELLGKVVPSPRHSALTADISLLEVKSALFSMADSQSLGPDGYNPCFFKKTWHIVQLDLYAAVREFFVSGKLNQAWNATFIALVPKSDVASSVTDFRPLSLCNVVYKLITKILASRLKMALEEIINQDQGAFVPNRSIFENIFIAQDILKHYDRKNISP